MVIITLLQNLTKITSQFSFSLSVPIQSFSELFVKYLSVSVLFIYFAAVVSLAFG